MSSPFWEWAAATLPAGGVVSGVGVTAFVAAILTDRLMTKGQHDRRTADLKEAHALAITTLTASSAALLKGWSDRYDELKVSRDYYREARLVERDRADKVTDQLAEVAELAKLTNALLKSFTELVEDAPR